MPGSTINICRIVLDNDFPTRGESARVDLANFDKKIDERIACDQAPSKLWPLFGFLLAERRVASAV